MRVGIGYDSHRFASGRRLVLGGVEIPHDRGLTGHSDADVLAHALTDAILGAAGAGDIGRLFPDTDPTHKDADSMRLLAAAHERGVRALRFTALAENRALAHLVHKVFTEVEASPVEEGTRTFLAACGPTRSASHARGPTPRLLTPPPRRALRT